MAGMATAIPIFIDLCSKAPPGANFEFLACPTNILLPAPPLPYICLLSTSMVTISRISFSFFSPSMPMVGARCTKIPWTAWWRQFTTRGWWASTRGSCHAGWEWLLGPSLSGFHSRKYGGSVGPSLGNNCHKAKPECNAIKCNSSKSIFTIIRLNGIWETNSHT